MNQDVSFGFEGPQMKGTWINPQTGHKIIIRDNIVDETGFKAITADGQMLDFKILQNYVQYQGNEKGEKAPGVEENLSQVSNTPLVSDITVGLATDSVSLNPEDIETIRGNSNPVLTQKNITAQEPTNEDQMMIKRVLGKQASPEIKHNFVWKVPERQLDILINVLGVEPENIVEYYVNKLDVTEVFDKIKKEFKQYIENIINPEPEKPVAKKISKTKNQKTKK